uniref:von Willebrand factor type A domain protein n=1 Tax=Pithovirus LCPAC401 TaxID=2506595 RepID=A0A481ZAP3_9VIRU|nr:MAG: von Willebrand factor type A domain protein [Pithovirus LCPAC401]
MNITTRSYLYEDQPHIFLKIEGNSDVIKSTCNREVILIIDISGSMKDIIDTVRLSIESFENVIDKEIQDIRQANNDEQKNIPITLIIFNDKAEILERGIDKIKPKGRTNISKAIDLAFDIKSENKMTWIILFSDGCPNIGITTEEGFRNLVSMKPKRTKIICAGFEQYSPSNILAILGDFKFIQNEKDIDPFFKSVAFEIITATHVNFSSECIPHEEVLLPDVIFTGSTFSYVFKYKYRKIILKYTNLEDNEIIEETIESKSVEIDDEIKDTMITQKVQHILLQMKNSHTILSKQKFLEYRKKMMNNMLKMNNRTAMIKVQTAFDLIYNKNNHEYESMLTIEKTQSQGNYLQSDFVNNNSLPPRYKSHS